MLDENSKYFLAMKRPMPSSKENIAVFLDRDGVLIVEKDYLKRPEDLELINGCIDALRILNSLNAFIAIVSNQAGVAKGKMTIEDVYNVNNKLISELKKENVYVHCLMFCPFHSEGVVEEFSLASRLRKPDTGMFDYIAGKYGLDNVKRYMIGDKKIDIEFGKNIGASSLLVKTGYGIKEMPAVMNAYNDIKVFDTVLEAIKWIRSTEIV